MLLSLTAAMRAEAQQTPTLSTVPQPNDRLEVTQCIAECFENTLVYSMPGYITRDISRTVSLLYRSGRAHPYGKVELDVTDPSAPAGATFLFELQDPSNNLVTFTNGSQTLYFRANPSGTTRIAAQFDALAIPTGRYGYSATVEELDANGNAISALTHAYPGVIIINDSQSWYGAGFEVLGTERVFAQTDGVLATDASGSASFFYGSCSLYTICNYTSPAGDFSSLQTTELGTYVRYLPDGTTITFDANGYQTSVADRFGNRTNYSYRTDGPAGRLSAITDPTGTATSFDYQTGDMPQWKTYTLKALYANGRNAYFGIDNSYHFTDFVDVDGTYFGYASYDAGNRLTHFQDRNGNGWDYYYHGTASLDSVMAPAIDTSGGSGWMARATTRFREPSGTLLVWAAQGHGGSFSDAAAAGADTRASVTTPRGYATYYTTTRYGAPSKIENAVNAVTTLAYDANTMQLRHVVTPSGHDLNYVWDGPRLTVDSDATTGVVIHTAYETTFNQPTHIWGNTTERWFTYKTSQTGYPLQTAQEGTTSAPVATYVFDSYGRLTQFTDPMGHVTTYTYSSTATQNLYQLTEPGSRTTTYTTDGYGRVSQVVLPDGSPRTAGFDNLNRITWSAGARWDTTRYYYGNVYLDSVSDARHHTYKFVHNALGGVERETRPGSSISIYTAFDVDGNLYKQWNRKGYRVDFTYDPLDRLATRTQRSEGGMPTSAFSYDPNERWIAASNAEASDTIYFDVAGRVSQETQKPIGLPTLATSSFFENTFGVRSRICMGGPTTCFANAYFNYDPQTGYLSSITDPWGGTTNVSLNADALPAKATFVGGATLTMTRAYSSVHQQSTTSYDLSAVNAALYRAYQQDKEDRIIARTTNDGVRRSYTYDLNGELTGWADSTYSVPSCHLDPDYGRVCTSSGESLGGESYSYDLTGNRTDKGAVVDPGSNRLTAFDGATLSYDEDGNVIEKRSGTNDYVYGWNTLGQLVSVQLNGVTIATYGYDAFGRRVRKTASGQAHYYLWDGDQIAAELDAAGNPLTEYTYYPGIDRLHAVTTTDGNAYYAAPGEQSDVVGLVRGSDKTVQAQYSYRPFAEFERNDAGAGSLRWHGLPYDSETGMYFVRARYYDPAIGRFMAEDPIGLSGGANLYVFANNDPIDGKDPTGLDGCSQSQEDQGYKTVHGADHDWCVPPTLPPVIVTASPFAPTAPPVIPIPAIQWGPQSTPVFSPTDASAVAAVDSRHAAVDRAQCEAMNLVAGLSAGKFGGRMAGAMYGIATGRRIAQTSGVVVGMAAGVASDGEMALAGYRVGEIGGYLLSAANGARKGGAIGGMGGLAVGGMLAAACAF